MYAKDLLLMLLPRGVRFREHGPNHGRALTEVS
jgi:hypothetical protein